MKRLLSVALLCGIAGPAFADGPGPSEETIARSAATHDRYTAVRRSAGPPRRVTGGPDYVGSDYGLGKPSYLGIGTRPDWGRSSVD